MAAFFTRAMDGGQVVRAFIRLEGFGLCAEIALDVAAGKELAMFDATWSLVAAHADSELPGEVSSGYPAVAPGIIAFVGELDQMKAAAIAAVMASSSSATRCRDSFGSCSGNTLHVPKPPAPSGPAGAGIGRRNLPRLGSEPSMYTGGASSQDRLPVPPAPQRPTAPPGQTFRRSSGTFRKTQSSPDVQAAGQTSSPSSGPKQGEEDRNSSSFGAEEVDFSPSNLHFTTEAPISSVRLRMMQHRQCAVQALSELPALEYLAGSALESRQSSGSSSCSGSSASKGSSTERQGTGKPPPSPQIAPNCRTSASGGGGTNNDKNNSNSNNKNNT
ncbi:unnamed protein product [Polarella glacialis]|uniref:Uncharacterized protein n=1 Tax=Polarella glacialis TaxID=89957 RepID=A0A813IYF6_POLGL|nr:unnamed protein product [Polarella glacialis]